MKVISKICAIALYLFMAACTSGVKRLDDGNAAILADITKYKDVSIRLV